MPDDGPEEPEEEEDCNTSKEDLAEVFPNTDDTTLQDIADYINQYAADFGIDTKEELQHFLAQAGHESGEFDDFEESLNYRVKYLGINYWGKYFNPWTDPTADPNKENPFDYEQYPGSTFVEHELYANYIYSDETRGEGFLGNVNPGDGYKFRGRGIIQLTGRYNYTTFNSFYQANFDNTVDFLQDPSPIANDTEIAVISALWFFQTHVMENETIDEDTNVKRVTKLINGGYNGLSHRKSLFQECQDEIDCI